MKVTLVNSHALGIFSLSNTDLHHDDLAKVLANSLELSPKNRYCKRLPYTAKKYISVGPEAVLGYELKRNHVCEIVRIMTFKGWELTAPR